MGPTKDSFDGGQALNDAPVGVDAPVNADVLSGAATQVGIGVQNTPVSAGVQNVPGGGRL